MIRKFYRAAYSVAARSARVSFPVPPAGPLGPAQSPPDPAAGLARQYSPAERQIFRAILPSVAAIISARVTAFGWLRQLHPPWFPSLGLHQSACASNWTVFRNTAGISAARRSPGWRQAGRKVGCQFHQGSDGIFGLAGNLHRCSPNRTNYISIMIFTINFTYSCSRKLNLNGLKFINISFYPAAGYSDSGT